MARDLHVTALLLRSEMLGMKRTMNLFLLDGVNMVKKQGEQ